MRMHSPDCKKVDKRPIKRHFKLIRHWRQAALHSSLLKYTRRHQKPDPARETVPLNLKVFVNFHHIWRQVQPREYQDAGALCGAAGQGEGLWSGGQFSPPQAVPVQPHLLQVRLSFYRYGVSFCRYGYPSTDTGILLQIRVSFNRYGYPSIFCSSRISRQFPPGLRIISVFEEDLIWSRIICRFKSAYRIFKIS